MSSWLLCAVLAIVADGPADNVPDRVRPVPPPGAAIPQADRDELQTSADALAEAIAALPQSPAFKRQPKLADLIPDVQVLHKAVRDALKYNEFFHVREVEAARRVLKLGRERAEQLRQGEAPWTTASGLVVRGYRSKIDDSVQPYGLVAPPSYRPDSGLKHRLDFWCHGRGETLSELNFIDGRLKTPGEFTPRDAIVLHLYGRYCNANKFAGEIDLFEAFEHVKRHYPIDEDRVAIRGFSMGGAACWQFAVHYPGVFAAAAPGAGFSETPEFLRVFQSESVQPTWYERKLWHLYDCTDYALNLANLPTVAYSGEIDRQKQAADIMAQALAKSGLTLAHLIGPQTAHKYHPQTRDELNRRIDAIMERGRDPMPRVVRFSTYTLRYDRSHWVRIDAMTNHWSRAAVIARIVDPRNVELELDHVEALTLEMPPGRAALDPVGAPSIRIGSQTLEAPPVGTDRSWTVSLHKEGERWVVGPLPSDSVRKRHGLQGPIDDAFMDRFVMVRPTGPAWSAKVSAWADGEMKHAIDHWRKQFRGEARVKDDRDVTAEDIADSNLILWGDPGSNQVLAKIADRLPIAWTKAAIQAGKTSKDADGHALILIAPNPLNPQRCVVLNSGFTFREYDYLNNARQVPKLPDHAIVDLSVSPNSRGPGKIVHAGFFGERWEYVEPWIEENGR